MKSTGIFWIREDFRIDNNPALSFATNNHENVIALYIYNNNEFDNKREAQKWWLFKSLESIKTELSKFKINLEILKGDELDIFSKLKKKDNVCIYWNKIYEPDVISKGKKIRDLFIKNEIEYKYFKGNILNIHPSLLPKYKGLNTHKRVLNNKEKYSGCTVHFVNSRLDSGKIILQKKIKISKKETETSLAKKILAQEHKLYPKAILKVFNL